MKTLIKQLFCKHNWKLKGGYSYLGFTLKPNSKRCVKCKKQILIDINEQLNFQL